MSLSISCNNQPVITLVFYEFNYIDYIDNFAFPGFYAMSSIGCPQRCGCIDGKRLIVGTIWHSKTVIVHLRVLKFVLFIAGISCGKY